MPRGPRSERLLQPGREVGTDASASMQKQAGS